MKVATRAEAEALVAQYNSDLLNNEEPITVGEMCEIERLSIVECPHPLACERCYGKVCMNILPWE